MDDEADTGGCGDERFPAARHHRRRRDRVDPDGCAPITGERGESGTLTGFLINADIPDAETGDLDADRLGQLSFDLGNGNTLVAIGETTYRGKSVEMSAAAPQLRVVAGGTGTFMGARGQVTTTRNSDGTYRHEFTLIDD